ncbi:hydrogenase-1 expression HyaE [Allomesorhizobium alhagi]|uniref:Hydrogenase-1 expression HyaE n=1 Tax=Mesorhizobium alhagi CCNWXJ12-2 TaxID=1107882 RepID=H0HX68_9HYPH|nr:hydrogenase-1 expression HyaE [Mesorhizobium alhagi]EHK54665.1 hydrogenase-1 expression HyaE [Mesorhizobium alhagi CCNWXJ12-2]
MFSPALATMMERHRIRVVDEANIGAFAKAHEFTALFFPGDWLRLAESNDVAVILPELVQAFQGVFKPAVVSRESERKLQTRYRFNAFPALVFLRNGEYLGVIKRVLDWQDYLTQIAGILTSAPSAPPPFEFPHACATHDHHGHDQFD